MQRGCQRIKNHICCMYLLWATIGQYSLLSPHSPINRKVTKLQKRKDKVPVHLQSFVVVCLGINIFFPFVLVEKGCSKHWWIRMGWECIFVMCEYWRKNDVVLLIDASCFCQNFLWGDNISPGNRCIVIEWEQSFVFDYMCISIFGMYLCISSVERLCL